MIVAAIFVENPKGLLTTPSKNETKHRASKGEDT